ncbi:MAG: DUF4231 domain-containing protein [Verrucomicrobia bacterium]|nr:DUF4231 domain-containing protein [Verrucomicrobiota bacterium]
MQTLSPSSEPEAESPLMFCVRHIKAFQEKADHNKSESLRCFIAIILSTLGAPMFVMLGQDWFWGKLLPSSLSLAAAAGSAWLQLRKPQQLWAMYRDAQRKLEDQKTRFAYNLPPYSDEQDPAKLLVVRVADVALGVHYQWMPLVPRPGSTRCSGKMCSSCN